MPACRTAGERPSRSGAGTVETQESARLPLLQEREMWRIAQEAITNVERHARAKHVSVQWRYDGDSALLVVSDDGQGFPMGKAGRIDSYGMVGMRERADAIGAHLEFDSTQARGTTIRCRRYILRSGNNFSPASRRHGSGVAWDPSSAC